MQRAMPETTALMMKITGIKGDIHRALALTEPKMKPGQSFSVPADSSFEIEVAEPYHYVCHFG